MILARSMSPGWLSNTYLVGDRPGGTAVLIDTGGPPEPVLERIAAERLTVSHVLCTHHHVDHIAGNRLFREKFGCPVCAHSAEAGLFPDLQRTLQDGEEIRTGELNIRAIHIPGHTLGQLAFLVNETELFTGDTLFRDSVGGTRAPGHTTFEDLRHSIMEKLMALPRDLTVRPGHTEPTTLGREWEHNPFVRMWRGLEAPGSRPCAAMGEPATLLLRATDYDGGSKCWVRFVESGLEDVVPGSRVQDS